MTLIVARSFQDQIRIISDSKKTNPVAILRGAENNVLKAVILHPALCVGFAGSVGRAQAAIERLNVRRGASFELDKVLKSLLTEHQASNYTADFIVAALSPSVELFKVSGGCIERDLNTCWIGNRDAFSDYQKHFHTNPQAVKLQTRAGWVSLVCRMEMAFRAVIESNAHPDVGEFVISVAVERKGFIYAPSANTSIVQQSIPSHTPTALKFGNAAEGGYSYSLMTPMEAGIGAVGVHFQQGNLGVLFYPAQSPDPIPYSGMSADQFQERVRQDFGFEIEGPRFG